jgi:hypothetical protein
VSKIDEGGAAFPLPKQVFGENIHLEYADKGMTLRDYFAAIALQGLLADGYNGSCNRAAINAYDYADAMIKARKGEA